jgi:hypothetical protein
MEDFFCQRLRLAWGRKQWGQCFILVILLAFTTIVFELAKDRFISSLNKAIDDESPRAFIMIEQFVASDAFAPTILAITFILFLAGLSFVIRSARVARVESLIPNSLTGSESINEFQDNAVPKVEIEIVGAKLEYNSLLQSFHPDQWLMKLRVRLSPNIPVKLSGFWLVIESGNFGDLPHLANSFQATTLPYPKIETYYFNVAAEITNELFRFWVVASVEGVEGSIFSPVWERFDFHGEFGPVNPVDDE